MIEDIRDGSRGNRDDGRSDKQCRWHGGVYNAADGVIYAMPSHSRAVLTIDTNPISPSSPGNDDDTNTTLRVNQVSLLGVDSGIIPPGGYKWGGAVVGSDDRVYGIPSDINQVLVIEPRRDGATNSSDEGLSLQDIPRYADEASAASSKLPFRNKWQGGVRVGDSIYCVPCNALSVLKITTDSSIYRNPAIITEIGVGEVPKGRCKWQGGSYSESDHCIYCVPEHSDAILKINCTTDQISLLPLPSLKLREREIEKKEKKEKKEIKRGDEVSVPKNVHFSVPRRQLKADIVSPTADALAAQYDLGTQLDLPLLSDPRYFIADIDAETLSVMEEEPGSRQRVLQKYLDAQYGGLLGGTVVGNARDLLRQSISQFE